MGDHTHGKASAVRVPVASPSSPALALSPIVQLQPTGYRDIQPFQRGQGWHSNGKATAKLRRARETSERVVFPVIPTHQGAAPVAPTGPSVSAVNGYESPTESTPYTDDARERDEAEIKRVMSPSVSAIPVPPPQRPQRPSSGSQGEGNQRSGSSGSFRTRNLISSATAKDKAAGSDPVRSPLASSSTRRSDTEVDEAEIEDMPPPDPETMEKLWQEYNERTKRPTKTVDHATYHRKMQHRYNESKALREQIAKLEMELEDTRRERDEALETAQRSEQQRRASLNQKLREAEEEPSQTTSSTSFAAHEFASNESMASGRTGTLERSLASVAARLSNKLHSQQQRVAPVVNQEEVSYHEKCFKLERTLATAKEAIAELQAKLLAMHGTDTETIASLRAKLELEQKASKLLSVQLRETNAAFRSTADELVTTQVALEKEQIEKEIVIEQIQAETKQLMSDHKRKELQSRVKNVVRTLGKEALHQKMEALHTRVLTAEHHMRAAQLEVLRLQNERDLQQQRLDEILSSRQIKYHGLASKDGGIPGILQRATSLYHGTRTINDQFLLVEMLYEDTRGPRAPLAEPTSNQNEHEPPTEPEDGYAIHILVYEAFTAQDDYISFHLRDIRRLVPDAEKYLAPFADRKHHRFLDLAELLLAKCHIGYKNGHIVLTEIPLLTVGGADQERRELPIYRGTRYLRSSVGDPIVGGEVGSEQLMDLVVSEVYDPSVSQLWWLEVQATPVDGDGSDSNQLCESRLTIDNQQVKAAVATFASYRPSESLFIGKSEGSVDTQDVFSIHEELLEPLFERMVWKSSTTSGSETSPCLVMLSEDGSMIVCGDGARAEQMPHDPEGDPADPIVSVTPESLPTATSEATAKPDSTAVALFPRVLDHRSIVSMGDAFYCVQIEEVWDGELMLRITMEEPDDITHRYKVALLESEIAIVASYLHRTGSCDEDYSSRIKYGLPPSLHEPLCKLLKRHMRPIVSQESTEQGTKTSPDQVARISIESLFQEIQEAAQAEDPEEEGSNLAVSIRTVELEEEVIIDGKTLASVRVVASTGEDELDSGLLHEVLTQFQELKRDRVATKERIGCRTHATAAFFLATGYSGFMSPFHDVVVIDTVPVGSSEQRSSDTEIDEASQRPLVVSQVPMRQALAALGHRLPHK